MGLVKTELRGGVAVLTLNDPQRRNALSLALAEEIRLALAPLASSPEVGAVVVTGEPPAFSAGADLSDLEQASRERLRRIYDGFLSVAKFPLPTIAAVNGAAVGAGLNLALACDLRLAARSARFESRFLDLALHPGGGHTWMLRQLLGPQGAAALVLCGEPLDGEEAARRGLAWACVEDGALLDEALRLASRAAAAPRALMTRLKATLRSMTGVHDHEEAVERELEQQLWSVGQPAFAERLEALRRRLGKRK
ncbi:MAG: enoyl-CoA hydratase [Planctomycetota bacterium]|jgi:enoyl-CoA hydratase